jgi:hypothetical protein
LAVIDGTTPASFDMSSFDFAHSGCSFCHTGGGPLEYDREGYRYDGNVLGSGLGLIGPNPAPKNGDYATVAAGVISSRASAWNSGGVAEADCLMCHYASQYTQVDRNFAAIGSASGGYTQPQYSATLGLVGAKGQAGLFLPSARAANNVNPSSPASGTWTTTTLPAEAIVKAPKKEGCAVCHLVDKSWWANCAATPSSPNCGPASKPMGATAWQRYIAPGTVADGDYSDTPNNKTEWKVAKGKPEGGKRAESINDTNNPDAHMDNDKGNLTCSQCHHALSGNFPAVLDHHGDVVYPELSVQKIDHQFAKGNNLPDGKNMDQLDSTVTCASCHVTRTHPNAAGAPDPTAKHAGFPSDHLRTMNCRTCHIPLLNGPQQWLLADFTAGPYRTFERNQVTENASGVGYKPLYMWRKVAADSNEVMLEPVVTTTVAIWADGSPLKPTFQRAAMTAAQARRTAQGYNATTFLANWPLNQPQGGDTALIVNTTAEISDMIPRVASASGAATPVMNLYLNAFDASHNVAPVSSGKILGSPSGGGCVMCHSSSDPASRNFSPKSVGFFDRTHKFFNNPVEDDPSCSPASTEGLIQTTIGGVRRVSFALATKKQDGSDLVIDLADVGDCKPIRNTVNQGEVLGFSREALLSLMNPASAGVPIPSPSFGYQADASGLILEFDASATYCPSGDCAYSWALGDGSTAIGTSVIHTYAAGTYSVTLTVLDNLKGTQAKKTTPINVVAPDVPPTASGSLGWNPNTWTATVIDASTDDHGVSKVTMTFGDNSMVQTGAQGGSFTRTYGYPGTFGITHKAIDTIGQMSTTGYTVTAAYFSIGGTVVASNGTTPIRSAVVRVKRGTTVVRTLYSAANGTFNVTNLKPGTYTIEATKTGFAFAIPAATITVGPSSAGNVLQATSP